MSKLEMIAAEAGVSKHTVARVLNGKTKEVWPSTIKRAENIRKLARKYGYRTNAAAAAIRSKCFNATGLLLSTTMHKASIHWHTQAALLKIHHELDRHLITGQLDDTQLTTDGQLPKLLRQWAVDGLLIFYSSDYPSRLLNLLKRDNVPAVWMNTDLPINTVRPDDEQAGYQATQRLLEAGHTRIAYLYYGRTEHYSVHHRKAGYEKAMTQAGRVSQVHMQEIAPTWEIGQRADAIRALLASPDRPTAIIANGQNTTLTTMYMAAAQGLQLPRDLSLIAIADMPVREVGIETHTLVVDHEQFARHAVDMLQHRMNDLQTDQPTITIPFIEIPGQTIKVAPSC